MLIVSLKSRYHISDFTITKNVVHSVRFVVVAKCTASTRCACNDGEITITPTTLDRCRLVCEEQGYALSRRANIFIVHVELNRSLELIPKSSIWIPSIVQLHRTHRSEAISIIKHKIYSLLIRMACLPYFNMCDCDKSLNKMPHQIIYNNTIFPSHIT